MFTYFRLYLWFLGQYSCNHLDECMQSTLLVCYHIFVPASLLSLRHLFHILETWRRRLPFWRKCRYIIVISNCKPSIRYCGRLISVLSFIANNIAIFQAGIWNIFRFERKVSKRLIISSLKWSERSTTSFGYTKFSEVTQPFEDNKKK